VGGKGGRKEGGGARWQKWYSRRWKYWCKPHEQKASTYIEGGCLSRSTCNGAFSSLGRKEGEGTTFWEVEEKFQNFASVAADHNLAALGLVPAQHGQSTRRDL